MELAATRMSPVLEGARPAGRGMLLWAAPSLALFFAMVFMPTAMQTAKGALLLLAVLVAGCARALSRRRTLHTETLLWGLALCAAGLFFMLRGAMRGEPGALRVGTVYVLWPAAFVVLAAGAGEARCLRLHVGLLVAAALASSIYGLEFVLEQGGWIPRSIFPDLFADQGVGFYEGFVELRLPSLAVLPFVLPFLIAAAVCWGTRDAPVRRRFIWPALVAALLLSLLSGRRAVLLVVSVAPLLVLGLLALLPRAERRALRGPVLVLLGGLTVSAFGLGGFLASTYGFDVGVLWQTFREGFDPTASESSSIRAVQLSELLRGWSEHPLLGAGHGGFVRSHVRDAARPWSYELSYPTLLFQTGLVGLFCYGALFGWLFARGIAMIRAGGQAARTMLPVLVGLACFLVANATNPYLLKFDFMWTVFLPLALINRWLVERDDAAERGRAARPALEARA